MNSLFNEHKIDYIIHGDDPCLLPDGTDAYALAKKAGRYKQIKRTEGVSSTDIVGSVVILSALSSIYGIWFLIFVWIFKFQIYRFYCFISSIYLHLPNTEHIFVCI